MKSVEEVKKKPPATQPKIKVTKKKSVSDEFDLEGQFEKLVYEDIIYIHNLENNKIFDVNNKEIGSYKNKKISWSDDEYKKQHSEAKGKYNKVDQMSSSSDDEDSSDDSASSSDEEVTRPKKDVNNIKYRKHKLSLKSMSNVTPKVYNNKFRGWGFTNWGD